MATVSDLTLTTSGLNHIDALLNDSPNLNYLLPDTDNTILYTFSISENNEDNSALTAFSATQMAATRNALDYVSGVTGVEFQETGSGNDALFHFSIKELSGDTSGYCSFNWNYRTDGADNLTLYEVNEYIYLDSQYINDTVSAGSEPYQVLLHEAGHALGLKHPFEGSDQLASDLDSTANTVMSYTWEGGPYSTYQAFDLAALAWIYGGDGLGGTYGLGEESTGMIYTGSALDETIQGGSGNDTLASNGGSDTLMGGTGNDTYQVDSTTDKIIENATAGTDLVQSALTWTLASNVEKLTLTGSSAVNGLGNTTANTLTGNAAANSLNGGAGNDSLSGGSGNDTLLGGKGTDRLSGGSGADTFRFISTTYGQDVVSDFSTTARDKLSFSSPNFGNLTAGTLASSRFAANTSGTATTTSQRFIFETDTKILRYDADGSGAGSAIKIATLSGVATLSASSIVITSS